MTKHIIAALALVGSLLYGLQAFAQNCPANSHVASQSGGKVTCQCNSGYVMSGGQCVRG